MHAALSPVIGQAGVAALYRRALHLSSADYPWLAAAYEGATTPGDFTAFREALAGQTSAVAGAAHDAMLQTLQRLLANLIGPSLTARLLEAVWPVPTNTAGPAVQDNTK